MTETRRGQRAEPTAAPVLTQVGPRYRVVALIPCALGRTRHRYHPDTGRCEYCNLTQLDPTERTRRHRAIAKEYPCPVAS